MHTTTPIQAYRRPLREKGKFKKLQGATLAAHELRDAGAATGNREGLLCLRTFARGVAAAAAGAAATSANASFKHVAVTAAAAAAAAGSGEGLHF